MAKKATSFCWLHGGLDGNFRCIPQSTKGLFNRHMPNVNDVKSCEMKGISRDLPLKGRTAESDVRPGLI